MTPQSFIVQTGPFGLLLVFCSVAGVVIAIERFLKLHRARLGYMDFHKGLFNVLKQGNIEEAISNCDSAPGPVASVTRAAILNYDESSDTMLRAVQEAGLAEIPRMQRSLNLLLALATIAPLIGLLGTMVSLMEALQIIQMKAPLIDSGDLAAGLRRSLFTSAAGLVVAIGLFGFHALLVGMVKDMLLEMEQAAANMMHFLLSSRPKPRGVSHEVAGRPA